MNNMKKEKLFLHISEILGKSPVFKNKQTHTQVSSSASYIICILAYRFGTFPCLSLVYLWLNGLGFTLVAAMEMQR